MQKTLKMLLKWRNFAKSDDTGCPPLFKKGVSFMIWGQFETSISEMIHELIQSSLTLQTMQPMQCSHKCWDLKKLPLSVYLNQGWVAN